MYYTKKIEVLLRTEINKSKAQRSVFVYVCALIGPCNLPDSVNYLNNFWHY